MNQTTKNPSIGFNAVGGGLETYKSLGDVFGIQAAVDSMKTATYANHEIVASTASNSSVNASTNGFPQTRHLRNMTDNEKESTGGKYKI